MTAVANEAREPGRPPKGWRPLPTPVREDLERAVALAHGREGAWTSAAAVVAAASRLVPASARWVVSTSLRDAVLVAVMAELRPGCDVVFVDTGYHFGQTLEYLPEVEAATGVPVSRLSSGESRSAHEERLGPHPFRSDPDLCCARRKVAPLVEALGDYDVWVTGVRRADSARRAGAVALLWDDVRDVLKVNPLVLWSDDDVAAVERERALPRHPLHAQAPGSIGCAPCTALRPPDGDDPRAGRWPGTPKTECGLHLEFA